MSATEAREALAEAVSLIETGENRAMATDGPVPHFRGELDDREWRRLWVALGKVRAALAALPDDGREGFVRCPLCGDPERVEDIVGGVCLTCADGIAFAQNARRGSIEVPIETCPRCGATDPDSHTAYCYQARNEG